MSVFKQMLNLNIWILTCSCGLKSRYLCIKEHWQMGLTFYSTQCWTPARIWLSSFKFRGSIQMSWETLHIWSSLFTKKVEKHIKN